MDQFRNRDFGETIVFVPNITFAGCHFPVVDIYLLLKNSTDKLMKMNRWQLGHWEHIGSCHLRPHL